MYLALAQDQCLLCNNGKEENTHLSSLTCNFIRQVLTTIKRWLDIFTTANNLSHILAWIRRRSKGSKFKNQVMKASILAIVYNIWQERHNALWNAQISTVQKVVLAIKIL